MPQNEAASYLGQKLQFDQNAKRRAYNEADEQMVEQHNLSRLGEKIGQRNSDLRDGWLEVDRALLQERDVFYPEDWVFRILPAEVEAIKNWSTIDEENPLSVDAVFNEVIKHSVSISTPQGRIPWGNINSWDRTFFLLLVREYTFKKGERAITWEEDCNECDSPVTFTLNSLALQYEVPDEDVMKYYDRDTRAWHIDPYEFGLDEDEITLYIPTLEKEEVVKKWWVERVRNKKKVSEVFLKFAPWMAAKYSKDEKIAEKQLKEIDRIFNSWDRDMFAFMDNVLTNIRVTIDKYLKETCPNCGEEVTSMLRFPDGISSLFSLSNRFKKFGSK